MDEQVFWCWPNLFPKTQKATFVVLPEETPIKQIKLKTMSTLWKKTYQHSNQKKKFTPMQTQKKKKKFEL